MIRSRARNLMCDRSFASKGSHIDESIPVNERIMRMIDDEIERTSYIANARQNGPGEGQRLADSGLSWYAKSFTYIYFIICGGTGAVKIGRADNVKKRMADLQVSNPSKLSLLCHFRAPSIFEPTLHTIFSKSRLRGEWFSITDELLDLAEIGNDQNYIGVLNYCKEMLERNKPFDGLNVRE